MSATFQFRIRHLQSQPPRAAIPVSNYRSRIFRFVGKLFSLFFVMGSCALAQQRFPPPDFENGHQLPITTTPAARAQVFQYLDVVLLVLCLSVGSWLIFKKRSRKAVLTLSFFSLLYFGFWRKGCVCSIGSLQNVALALGDSGYAVPLSVVLFFALPLLFALFAGRTFCAAVCPHGALQDLVMLKPVSVPGWLEQGLSILPFVYLGLGVLFAATGSAFIICQYDPFVPLFRMSGRALMVGAGVALLALGVFVGRPYCRFLCPYGALLKIGATLAKWRVRITPNYCTQCRLCETSCPFGALRRPESNSTEPRLLLKDRRRLAVVLVMLPALVVGFGFLGWRFSTSASLVHPTVHLAQRVSMEQGNMPRTGTLSPDDLALERARQTPGQILAEAVTIQRKFRVGGALFGAWVGVVIGVKLLSRSVRRRRTDYEPDRGECFACARCFEYCPNELTRQGIMPDVMAAEGKAADRRLTQAGLKQIQG